MRRTYRRATNKPATFLLTDLAHQLAPLSPFARSLRNAEFLSPEIRIMAQFLIQTTSGKARKGVLNFPKGDVLQIDTPAALIQSRRGLPIHLTPDLLEGFPDRNSRILQFSPLHFIESPDYSHVIQNGGSVHQYVGLTNHAFVAIARDPFLFEGQMAVSSVEGASFETPSGRKKVTCERYMEIVHALKPDLFSVLVDEVKFNVASKRSRLAVKRSLEWLESSLNLRKEDSPGCLAAIVGPTPEARRFVAEIVGRKDVFGFLLAGLGIGESPELRQDLIISSLENLPQEKLRFASGLGKPDEILSAISLGVDLFDSKFPHELTTAGMAFTFPVKREVENGPQFHKTKEISSKKIINLNSEEFRLDKTPILEGCQCQSCTFHSRAYLHHLLNAHEMTAHVLLSIHNTHHYLSFFKAIRDSIEEGRFEEYSIWFSQINGNDW